MYFRSKIALLLEWLYNSQVDNSYFTVKTALTRRHKYKHKNQNFSFFLCLRSCFRLHKWKRKNRSGMTQAQGYLPHVVMFGQWKLWIQITSRLNSFQMADGSDDFACARAWVEFRFHLGHPNGLRLCLPLCLRTLIQPMIFFEVYYIVWSNQPPWGTTRILHKECLCSIFGQYRKYVKSNWLTA